MVKLRRVYESIFTLESKKDLDDLKAYLGDNLFNDYMKIRDRIPKDQNEFKDFSKLKKKDKKDIQDFVSSFQSKSDKKKSDKTEGAEKLYEDSDWVVYKITSYPAAQLYGKGTKWCITGRYPGHEDRGQKYFDDYIEDNNLDGGYYFYLNKKDPYEKYCVLQTEDHKIHSIWDAGDTNKGSIMGDLDLPEIPEVTLKKSLGDMLLAAVKKNDYTKVKELLEDGVDPNLIDTDGNSILHHASYNSYEKIVKLLLKYGADPNIKNINNITPLWYASGMHLPEVVRLLLDSGADPNIKSSIGTSPLSVAFGKKDGRYGLDTVKILLDYGADPNERTYQGDPILCVASKNNDLEMVRLLLNAGANTDVKTKIFDRTPLQLASRKDIVDLLEKYGAKE